MEAVQKFDAKIISAKAVLLDIEGTTTSKSFVKDTLFPYVVENVSEFLTSNWETEDVKLVVADLRKLAAKDKIDGIDGLVEIIEEAEDNRASVIKSVVDNVKWQMSLDRKTSPLKALQGLVWEKGYKDGSIKGHVYDDVPEALSSWVSSGHRLYIYSSGSVAAQKLLFGHTEKGSLLDNFCGHFDTSVGAKQEADSYRAISKEIGSDRILFLTDIVKEADAAVEAGMSAVLLQRDSDTTFTDDDKLKYSIITSFAELPLASAGGKRKSVDNTEEELPPTKVAKTDESDGAVTVETTTTAVNESSESAIIETAEKKTEDATVKITDSVPASDNEAQSTDSTQETQKTENPPKSNEVEAMEVDSVTSNTKDGEISEKASDEPIEKEKSEQCDSTEVKMDEVVEEKPEVLLEPTKKPMEETVDSTNKEEPKTDNSTVDSIEKKVEVTETKNVDVSPETTDKNKLEENGASEKLKAESVEESKEAVASEAESVEESKEAVASEAESVVDSKSADQVETHTLKESNGIESNGTNGTKVEEAIVDSKKAEENGSEAVVESSTNGADSDKENDKNEKNDEDKKLENGTNGITEEAAQEMKVKKITTDSSPVPAPVEETA